MQSKSLAMCLHIKKMDLMMKKTGLTSLANTRIKNKWKKALNSLMLCSLINVYLLINTSNFKNRSQLFTVELFNTTK